MPLTPQDVRNKLFTPVRFKPGYDEDEVDAFLDEVETELTRLYGQIEHLSDQPRGASAHGPDSSQELARVQAEADERVRAGVAEAEQRSRAQIASLRADADAQLAALRAGATQPGAGRVDEEAGGRAAAEAQGQAEQAQAQLQQLQSEHAQLQQLQADQVDQHAQQLQAAAAQAAQHQQRAATAEHELARARSASQSAPTPPQAAQTGQLAALGSDGLPVQLPPPSPSEELLRRTLILAQRTADEAVAEARTEAARLVGTAKAEAEAAVGTAKAEADRTVGIAKAEADRTARTAATQHAELTRRRDADHADAMRRGQAENDLLMSKLEELRSFERDYRSRLRAYLHLQLRDLEAGAPKAAPSALPGERAAIGARPDEADEPAGADVDAAPGPLEQGTPPADTTEAAAPPAGRSTPPATGVLNHGDGAPGLRPAPLYGHAEARDR